MIVVPGQHDRMDGSASADSASAYFHEREKRLRALGLDPDDDDTWALPDYDLERLEEIDADLDWHPRVDQGQRVRCTDCLSNVRQDDDLRCEPCGFKHRRRKRCAAGALDG